MPFCMMGFDAEVLCLTARRLETMIGSNDLQWIKQ